MHLGKEIWAVDGTLIGDVNENELKTAVLRGRKRSYNGEVGVARPVFYYGGGGRKKCEPDFIHSKSYS